MVVQSIHHFNIRAPAAKLAQVKEFYCEVLGLREGARPPFTSQGYWLYAADQPIVHLVRSREDAIAVRDRQAALDHVAFRCSGLDALLARLQSRGIAYKVSGVPTLTIRQVLIRDPVGTGIELSFDAD